MAAAFGEKGSAAVARKLETFEELVASNLLESELRSTFARKGVSFDPGRIAGIHWILPDRPLSAEIERTLSAGYLRGADLWHVATALYITGEPGELTFVTLDDRQRDVARKLGFAT